MQYLHHCPKQYEKASISSAHNYTFLHDIHGLCNIGKAFIHIFPMFNETFLPHRSKNILNYVLARDIAPVRITTLHQLMYSHHKWCCYRNAVKSMVIIDFDYHCTEKCVVIINRIYIKNDFERSYILYIKYICMYMYYY